MKLIFASPTYGPIDPQAVKSQRIAMMHAARQGHVWLGDASPDKMKFDVARNAVCKATCDSEADAVFWCDSDVILPADAISRLAGGGQDFITGIYFQRVAPHWPLIAGFENAHFQWIVKWEPNMLVAIDGCGFGCVLTSTKLLREMDHEWFSYEKFSEDFDFCLKARKLGYQLWCDTGILCGHLPDPLAVTHETFQQVHPEIFGGKNGASIRPEQKDSKADLPQEGIVPSGGADLGEVQVELH